MRRVMVGGAIAAHPLGAGGNAWVFLQWVLGLRQLGVDTYYVEEIDGSRCFDDQWSPAPFDLSANARCFRSVVRRFGLEHHAALFDTAGGGVIGLPAEQVDDLARDTDLFVNLSGRFHRRRTLDAVRCRMYVDLDPGFVQIWQTQYGVDMNLAGHDVYVTVGMNLGADDCPLPTCGLSWHSTLPPVVLSEWQTRKPPGSAYTTVADWRGYSPVEWQGLWYGQKAEEILKIIELPRHVTAPLELCLAIHPDEPDLPRLRNNGWRLTAPRDCVDTADAYRDYIQASRGEFTAVKNGYVVGRSAWFSDRSACYLAAGRPVIVQDTGIGKYLPTGKGLLTFTDLDSAANALKAVEAGYTQHADAARALALQHLDSDRVLSRVLALADQKTH